MNLQQLRKRAGLSYQGVLAKYREFAPESAPASRNAVVQWERRGTKSLPIMRALSIIYGVSLETVEQAAHQTRMESASPSKKNLRSVTESGI
jgi:transcriptional regulator with XRE-family HTH domain